MRVIQRLVLSLSRQKSVTFLSKNSGQPPKVNKVTDLGLRVINLKNEGCLNKVNVVSVCQSNADDCEYNFAGFNNIYESPKINVQKSLLGLNKFECKSNKS